MICGCESLDCAASCSNRCRHIAKLGLFSASKFMHSFMRVYLMGGREKKINYNHSGYASLDSHLFRTALRLAQYPATLHVEKNMTVIVPLIGTLSQGHDFPEEDAE